MKSDPVTEYWLAHYVSKEHNVCVLCGNYGVLDTRGQAVTGAGVDAGAVVFCLCPNGRALRTHGAEAARVWCRAEKDRNRL